MKRSLTVLSHSLLMPLIFLLPTGLLQAAALSVPQKTTPIHREDRIIAQLSKAQGNFSLSNFDPKSDAFSFTNNDMSEKLSQIKDDKEWEKYFSDDLQFLFGSGVCRNEEELKDGYDLDRCELSVPAKEWLNDKIRSMQFGVCEGMSTASLYLWLAKNNPEQYKERTSFLVDPVESDFKELQTNQISSFNKDQLSLQKYITNLFILQTLTEVSKPTDAIRSEKPSEILERLIASMRVNPEDPYTMGIFRAEGGQDKTSPPKLTQGHSLAPFAVEDKGNGIYWVDVYDSNYPKETHYVEFDTKKETWRYQPGGSETLYQGEKGTKNLDLTRLSRRDRKSDGYFACPFCGHNNSSTGTDPVDISLVGQGELSITASDGKEIDGVEEQPFKGGLYKDVPPSYHIPPTQLKTPFKITLKGTGEDNNKASISMTGPNFNVGFKDIHLDKGKTLEMYFYPANDGPKLSFEGSDDTEIPTVFFNLTDESTETDYKFEISHVRLAKGKLVQVNADTERSRLYYGDNDGNEDDYTLSMKAITDVLDKPFFVEGTRTIPDKKLEYLAYGVWRANVLSPKPKYKYNNLNNLPFIQVPFKPSTGSNGEIFDSNTINNPAQPVRNAGSGNSKPRGGGRSSLICVAEARQIAFMEENSILLGF